MNKVFYIFIIATLLSNCTFKPVIKHHGVPFLEKKQEELKISKTNKNDIIKILGSPSTTSKFDNDIWIYIERKQTQSKIRNLGQMKILENNVLVLELDNYGLLKKKEFYNQDNMNDLKLTKSTTNQEFKKNSFIYEFMSSLRQKINDPLGTRAKKRKEISQR